MTRHSGLRQDSAAHKALCRLVGLGAPTLMSQLIEVLPAEYRSVSRFRDCVIDPLSQRGYVIVDNDKMIATPKGKEYAAEYLPRHLPVAAPYVGQVPSPRENTPPGQFNFVKHFGGIGTHRPGANDYRDIPSRLADERIPYRGY